MIRFPSLRAALAAAAFAASFAAHAVYLNPAGHGQALIYPYYTVRAVEGNAFNTYLTIANRSNSAKALRVRLREGRNGREVAGFNLFLGAGAAWSSAVVPTANGARLITRDAHCTSPAFAAGTAGAPSFLELSAANYTGSSADTFGSEPERVREGYAEVIEMATLTGASATRASFTQAPVRPPDCTNLLAGEVLTGVPNGGLSGTLTVINVTNGMDFTVNAEALAELSTVAFYRPASDPYPDWDAAQVNPVAGLFADGALVRFVADSGLSAVEMALMRGSLRNELVLEAATQSATDWVVTFPTKRLRTAGSFVRGPFANALIGGGRDVAFDLSFVPRDGLGVTLLTFGCGFLCPPSHAEADLRLPFASTVVGFRVNAGGGGRSAVSDVLGSPNAWQVTLPTSSRSGQASLQFLVGGMSSGNLPALGGTGTSWSHGNGNITTGLTQVQGLPAVGFMVRTFVNGTLACTGGNCQGNYGGAFPHGFGVRVQ